MKSPRISQQLSNRAKQLQWGLMALNATASSRLTSDDLQTVAHAIADINHDLAQLTLLCMDLNAECVTEMARNREEGK